MEQLDLGPLAPATPAAKPARAKKAVPLADADPIARVAVDVAVAAMDRLFEYTVPAAMAETALPGTRVRVRVRGRLVDGVILSRAAVAEHSGRLTSLSKVLGVPVLTTDISVLSRAVADRFAGTLAEILRDAIPPRHAGAEKRFLAQSARGAPFSPSQPSQPSDPAWDRYANGAALLDRIASGGQARAALTVSSADDPARMVADLAQAAGGRTVVVVPDARDADRFAHVLAQRFGDRAVRLQASDDADARYGAFLRIHAGAADVVIGTRNAAFAPIADVALLVIWDDGDPSLTEVRSPGWHALDVLSLRARQSGASLVVASHSRSVEAARQVETGWLTSVSRERVHLRDGSPRIITAADVSPNQPETPGVRMPHFAWRTIRDGLKLGPVLVQVARSGYQTALACQDCRTPAQCRACGGPLHRSGDGHQISCAWCGTVPPSWACTVCAETRMRAIGVGSARTAEELARAFPHVSVIVSGRADGVLDTVSAEPAIVVATVGAEPVADGGYSAAVLLDGNALLARSDLRSEEQTVRRWFNVTSLIRSAAEGGTVAVTADPGARAVQALVRADPIAWSERELAERRDTGLPPAVRAVSVTGTPDSAAAFAKAAADGTGWRVLGPVPVAVPANACRALIIAPLRSGDQLAERVKQVLVDWPAARDASGPRLQVRVDPLSLL